MNKETEKQIKEIVAPILKKGRPGDYDHTMRVLEIGRQLLEHEKGDMEIVIPSIYLHDLGWSTVDMDEFSKKIPKIKRLNLGTETDPLPGPPMEIPDYVYVHMEQSAIMGRTILEELDFPQEAVEKIVSIIAVHDDADKVFALADDSATMVFEADHVDRFHPEGNNRMKKFRNLDIPESEQEELKQRMLTHALEHWLKTGTAKDLAKRFASV